MNGFNRLITLYLKHYNKIFWIIFALAGAMFITAIFLGYFFLDLVLGLVLVVAGVHRIGEEFFNRSMRKSQDESVRTINELLQWAQKSYDYTRDFKDRHEKRLHRLDTKRANLENKTEEQFRDAVKKIIEVENKLNRFLKQPEPEVKQAPVATTRRVDTSDRIRPRLSDLTRNQTQAIQYLRKKGRITNKDYRKLFRISDKKAYNELIAMYQMGLIKREGKGRSTHYVLSF